MNTDLCLVTRFLTFFLIAAACSVLPVPARADQIKTWIDQLEDTKTKDRMGIAKELAATRDPRAMDALIWCLDDDDEALRIYADDQLIQARHPRLFEILTGEMADPSAAVRRQNVTAMGLIQDSRILAPLLTELGKDPDPEVRALAAKVLGNIKDPASKEPLKTALKDDLDINVKVNAAAALEGMGDAHAAGSLVGQLNMSCGNQGKALADSFLKSDSSNLQKAGKDWLASNHPCGQAPS